MQKSEIISKIRQFAESKTIDAAIKGELNSFEAEEICGWIKSKTEGSEEGLQKFRKDIARAGQRVLAYSFRAVRAYMSYFDEGTPWEEDNRKAFLEIAKDFGIDHNRRYFTVSANIGNRYIKRAGVVYDGKHLEEWIAEEGGDE